MNRLTLRKLKNTNFSDIYTKLLTSDDLSVKELETILALVISFISFEDRHINNLGYRMLLIYSQKTKDYIPLYEISLNKGLIPISQFIYLSLGYGDKYGNLQTEINDIINLDYKKGDTYRTQEQKLFTEFADDNSLTSKVLVAPTSYGKTELIINMIKENPTDNICIITPTKSLLAQTKKRIIEEVRGQKIITQPEMFTGNELRVVAVLTQERLLRLLQLQGNLVFDLVIVDEAHNLLEKYSQAHNQRSVLLASVIILCFARNNNLKCNYLTPFLKDTHNLKIKHTKIDFQSYIVSEHVKSEIFYFHDIKENTEKIYDQYLNRFINLGTTAKSDSDIVLQKANPKNIIYLNKPKDTEEFLKDLCGKLNVIKNPIIQKAVNDIKEFVHTDYNLASFLEKGALYHHGSVPESIRFFIEDLYTSIPELKFLVTTSTLLEGVNIPATKMFVLDPHKGRGYLSPSAFKNLIGRVCRFSEIFDPVEGSLDYLLPEIHLIKGAYCNSDFSEKGFVDGRKISVSKEFEDMNKNPLLENNEIKDYQNQIAANEFIENISESSIISDYNGRKAETPVGALCYQNNLTIFDIIENENTIMNKILGIQQPISDLDIAFEWINHLFFSLIDEELDNENLKRLKQQKARNFYRMLITWRMRGMKTSEMVLNMMSQWARLKDDELVYVGKWGDEKRGGHRELWTNISKKTHSEKINLAVVRLKEEYDFIDNEIIKYIEIMNSMNLLEESLYLKIKYGTSNLNKIALLNSGLSNGVANLIYEKYKQFYEIDETNSSAFLNPKLVQEMESNNENGVLVTEIKMNISEY